MLAIMQTTSTWQKGLPSLQLTLCPSTPPLPPPPLPPPSSSALPLPSTNRKSKSGQGHKHWGSQLYRQPIKKLSSLYSYEMIMKMYLNIFHKLVTSSRKRKKRKEQEINKVSSSKSNVHTYMHMHKNTEVKHLTSKWEAKYQMRISWRGTQAE